MAKTLFNSPHMAAVFAAVEQQINTGGPLAVNYRPAAKEFSADDKLGWLGGAIGQVARDVMPKQALQHVVAIAWVWLESFGIKHLNVAALVSEERIRQQMLLRSGKILFNCASPVVCRGRKFRVLAEELGEVAKAIDDLERGVKRSAVDLQAELVQVAAVSVAWLESFQEAL